MGHDLVIAFAAAAIGAAFTVILERVLEECIKEINLVHFRLRKHIVQLRKKVLLIQDFLSDAKEQSWKHKSVKRWLDELEAVASEAAVLLDKYDNEIRREKAKDQIRGKKKVSSYFSRIRFRIKMAHQMQDVNERLQSVDKDAVSLAIPTEYVYACNSSRE